MAVLGEYSGEVVGFEGGGEGEDVGEAGVNYGGECALHVDDEKSGLHFVNALLDK